MNSTTFFVYSILYETDLQANSISGESEIAKAKQAVCERGNKLNEVEEKTEQMANDAKVNSPCIL